MSPSNPAVKTTLVKGERDTPGGTIDAAGWLAAAVTERACPVETVGCPDIGVGAGAGAGAGATATELYFACESGPQ